MTGSDAQTMPSRRARRAAERARSAGTEAFPAPWGEVAHPTEAPVYGAGEAHQPTTRRERLAALRSGGQGDLAPGDLAPGGVSGAFVDTRFEAFEPGPLADLPAASGGSSHWPDGGDGWDRAGGLLGAAGQPAGYGAERGWVQESPQLWQQAPDASLVGREPSLPPAAGGELGRGQAAGEPGEWPVEEPTVAADLPSRFESFEDLVAQSQSVPSGVPAPASDPFGEVVRRDSALYPEPSRSRSAAGLQDPALGGAVFAEPAFGDLAFQDPGHGESELDGPGYQGEGYDGPSYDGPSYDAGDRDGAGYDGTAYAGAGFDGPGYGGGDFDGTGYDGTASEVPETFRSAAALDDSGVIPRPSPVRGAQAGTSDLDPVVPVVSSRHRLLRQLPQLGIVGAMVAATAGYAVVGDLGPASNGAEEEQPEFLRAGTQVDENAAEAGVDVAGELAAEARLEPDEDGVIRLRNDEEASRDGLRTPVIGCDGAPPEFVQQNGEMDGTYLCEIPWDGGESLRADAAIALTQLNEAFRAHYGRDICITDSYRSYAAQVSLKQRKPSLAARPGTSNHGYGLAVDLCGGVESRGSAYWWLMENAGDFGWENPRWAQSGGGGPFEPWHWEYTRGM